MKGQIMVSVLNRKEATANDETKKAWHTGQAFFFGRLLKNQDYS